MLSKRNLDVRSKCLSLTLTSAAQPDSPQWLAVVKGISSGPTTTVYDDQGSFRLQLGTKGKL